jgi:predicted flap endonuclease-1-like 5' DNA nuclease
MTIVIGLALIVLGIAIGVVIAWAFGAGASLGLGLGVLLVVAGAVIGFISEWFIDEAHRKNRELQRLMREREGAMSPVIQWATPNQASLHESETVALPHRVSPDEQNPISNTNTLADFLRKRDEEMREVRQQLTATSVQVETVRDEFEAYQRTHPDNLTIIKGIGPVYQWKLRDAGFNTFKQLAAADPDQLRRMLNIKNWQRVKPESWIEQARDWAQRGS